MVQKFVVSVTYVFAVWLLVIVFIGVTAIILVLAMTTDATIDLAYHELGVAYMANLITGGRPELIPQVAQRTAIVVIPTLLFWAGMSWFVDLLKKPRDRPRSD